MLKFSIIIPVYNRPEEVDELLQSLVNQTHSNFEVVIIEDGSKLKCENVVKKYSNNLSIKYFDRENVGQGFARNFGFSAADGDYFIVFDSDVVVPKDYLKIVNQSLSNQWLDAFGGPDAASPDFSDLQKAISYSMTSFFTTGGIRGKAKGIGKFQPRSFNMGISPATFLKTGGFAKRDMGEDVEFSLRMEKLNMKVGLIAKAFVYHKRRGDFADFFKQIFSFGRTRILLSKLDPKILKAVHFFPMIFTIGCLSIPVWFFISKPIFILSIILLSIYILLNFVDSTIKNKSIKVGLQSILAVFVQLFAYGLGFISEGLKRIMAR
ncbi:MAG: glycosyltransferase [Arcicella sp.]|nr:glycosyltransferase [Arcicella sp.]